MRQSIRNLYPCILQQERRQRPKPSKHQQPQYVENWQLDVALILSRTRDDDFHVSDRGVNSTRSSRHTCSSFVLLWLEEPVRVFGKH